MRLKNYLRENGELYVDQGDMEFLYAPLREVIPMMNLLVKAEDNKSYQNFLLWVHDKAKVVKDPDGHTIFSLFSTDTSKLTSDLCQISHEIKPCKINVGFPAQETFYDPKHSNLFLGPPLAILYPDMLHQENIEKLKQTVYSFMLHGFFKEAFMKGVIRHELTHWMDDAIRNLHITNRGGGLTGTSDPREIEAEIYGMRQVKRELGDSKWEQLSWPHLLQRYPSLHINITNEPEILKPYLKRMWREKLLTKKMIKTMALAIK